MNKDWKPGHGTGRGYPYDGIESKKQFVNRPVFSIEKDGKVKCEVDMEMFPGFDLSKEEELRDFLLLRSYDLQEALKTAEDQIAQMFEEDPFIPEDFGFTGIHKPATTEDAPIRIYQSTFSPKFTIHRKPQDPFDKNSDSSIWHILIKNEEGTFQSPIEAKIPCHRIAYALFYALGVQMVPEEGEGSEAPVKEVAPIRKGFAMFDVKFERDDFSHTVKSIVASDEKDAQTQAKFLIETTTDLELKGYMPGDPSLIEFSELKPILKQDNR